MLYVHHILIRNSLRLGFLLFPYKSLSFLGLWKSCNFCDLWEGCSWESNLCLTKHVCVVDSLL